MLDPKGTNEFGQARTDSLPLLEQTGEEAALVVLEECFPWSQDAVTNAKVLRNQAGAQAMLLKRFCKSMEYPRRLA